MPALRQIQDELRPCNSTSPLKNLSAGRIIKSGDAVEQRRFTSPVRSDHGGDFAPARALNETPSTAVSPPKRMSEGFDAQ